MLLMLAADAVPPSVRPNANRSEVDSLFIRIQPEHPERLSDGARDVNAFDADRWKELGALSPGAAIDTLVNDAKSHGGIRAVRLTGHTDRIGTEEYNLDLSLRRAGSVSDYLIQRGGVDPQVIEGAEVLTRFDPLRRVYRKLVFQGDRLVGMSMVNAIEQGGVLTALIQNRIPVTGPRERLLEPGFNYRLVA